MKLFPLYLISIGFVSAFSITERLPIPMVIASLLFINLILTTLKRKTLKPLNKSIMFSFYTFFIVLLISLLVQINSIGFNSKGVTHTLSYFAVVILYFIVINLTLKTNQISIKELYKYISSGVILVSIFTLTEFVSKNFLNINFDQYIYRPTYQNLDATYHNGQFIRARGTAEESGPLALYLLMFLPFVIYYFKNIVRSTMKMIIVLITIVAAVIVTFSATAFFEIITASVLVSLFYLIKKIKKGFSKLEYVFMYLITSTIIGISIFILYSGFKFTYLEGVLNKITFNNSASGDSRLERWNFALELVKEKPIFGHGAGFVAIQNGTGSTNMYLEILTATGILGFLCILAIFISTFINIFKIPGYFKLVYLFSFIVMSIHMFVISQYWSPWMWTLFAVINYHFSICKVKNPKESQNFLLDRKSVQSKSILT